MQIGVQMNREMLSNKIKEFLKKYAKTTEDGQFSSPDAYQLSSFVQCLDDESFVVKNIQFPNSEFSQGGYKRGGEEEHNEILELIESFMNPLCLSCKNKNSITFNFCMHCGKKI